ncbi:DegV family protein [Lachnospiraceae bacterium ZAX-1]
MSKIVVVTDSNSGITQQQAKEYGIRVLPMPFFINGETFFEDIDLTQEQFYERLAGGADISTSMPSVVSVTELWDELLKDYDQIVHIPMSSGLSGACETAIMCAREYNGKVAVVDNKRISVTQKQSVFDAQELVKQDMEVAKVKAYLEQVKYDSSIYIMLDTLFYLKKGGRITPAAAALGTLLKLKPVLQIHGEKLDAFAKARTVKQAKGIMMNAIQSDFEKKFDDPSGEHMWIEIAYTYNKAAALELKDELLLAYPNHDIMLDPLSLSVACHIGPGALAIACSKRIK